MHAARHLASLSLAAVVLASCATPNLLDSDEPGYVRALASFNAGLCSEAHDGFAAFVRSSCHGPHPGSGCQRAVWSEFKCDLDTGRPGRAIAEASALASWFSRPPPSELAPPLEVLRRQARAALDAEWAGKDRSARLQVALLDGTSSPYQVVSTAISLDEQDALSQHLGPLKPEAPTLVSIPPGNHVLVFTAQHTAVLAGGQYKFTTRSWQSFTAKPGEEVQVVIVVSLTDNPTTRIATQLPAVDFQFTPPSATP